MTTMVGTAYITPAVDYSDAQSQAPLPSCEQVVVAGWDARSEQQVYMACSTQHASFEVTWYDDAGNCTMYMCTAHKEEFELDASLNDSITAVEITEL